MANEITLATMAMAALMPVFKGAASEVGKKAVNAVWQKIKDKLSDSPAGKEALEGLQNDPASQINQESLKIAIAKALEKDPIFTKELKELLQEVQDSKSNKMVANATNGSTVIQINKQ